MELTAEGKRFLMGYCRLDEADLKDQPGVLETLYGAAVDYLNEAGVGPPREGTARRASYDLLAAGLVLDAYDRRDMTITGTIVADNPAFRRRLNQLKLTEPPAPEPGAGEG